MTSKHEIARSDKNIFVDLGFSAEEAETLKIRADLMLALRNLIETENWTVDQAAQQFGTTESQIKALIRGEINQFTIEPLVSMLATAGMKVHIEVLPSVALIIAHFRDFTVIHTITSDSEKSSETVDRTSRSDRIWNAIRDSGR